MLQSFPKLLITSDPEVALRFAASGTFVLNDASVPDISQTKGFDYSFRRAKDIYDTLTIQQKNNLLVDPYDEFSRSRLLNAEFSLGYGEGATENNFKFKISLIDYYGNLEDQFVRNLLNTQKFNETLKTTIANLSDQEKIKLGTRILAGESAVSKLNINQALLTRTFYFVYINKEDSYLNPITGQYYKSTIAESQSSFFGARVLNLEFVTTGHPSIASHLADITTQKSLYVAENIFKDIKSRSFEVTVDFNFLKLSNSPELLDATIKDILRKLFTKISGKETVLLLPDFGKLYTKYKNGYVPDLSKNVTETLTQSFNFKFAQTISTDYQPLKSFLTLLGFTFIEPYSNEIYTATAKISSQDRQRLKELSKTIKTLENQIQSANDNQLIQIIASIVGDFFEETKLDRYTLINNANRNNNPYRRVRDQYGGFIFDNNDQKYLLENDLNSTNFNNTALRGDTLLDKLDNLIGIKLPAQDKRKILIDIVKEMYLIKYEQILQQVNQNFKFNQTTRSSTGSQNSANIAIPTGFSDSRFQGQITFKISSEDPNKSGHIKIDNQIDFNEFLNNFAIRVGSLAGYNFIFRFSEEVDLGRLQLLNKYCKYNTTVGATTTGLSRGYLEVPVINNPTMPAVVIYEDFILNNLYAPIEGVPDSKSLSEYPLSKIDEDNFGIKSNYYKYLVKERKSKFYDNNGIMSPFDAAVRMSVIQDAIRNINTYSLNNTYTQEDLKKLGANLFKTVAEFSPTVTDVDSNSVHSLPVFIYQPNAGSNDPTTNILSWNLVADTLNTFVSYDAFIQDTANLIVDDNLLSSTMPTILAAFGSPAYLDTAKNIIASYVNSKDSKALDALKTHISENIYGGVLRNAKPDILKTIGTEDQQKKLGRLRELETKKAQNAIKPEEDLELTDLQTFINQQTNSQKEIFLDNVITELLEHYLLGKTIGKGFEYVQTYVAGNDNVLSKALRNYNLKNNLFNKIYTLSIKTEPYFQINSLFSLNCPVYVLLFRPYIEKFNTYLSKALNSQGTSEVPDYLLKPSVLSGFYQIIGFKHVMNFAQQSGLACYSEFTLRKNINFNSVD